MSYKWLDLLKEVVEEEHEQSPDKSREKLTEAIEDFLNHIVGEIMED